MPRKAWDDLSPAYRARLERAGVTEATHRSTDLRAARGHTPPPPAHAAPREPTTRYVQGTADTADRVALGVWRETMAPSWLPGPAFMSDDVAAALSYLPPPSEWRSVTFTPAPEGQPWTMTVERRGGGYPLVIEIPAGGHTEVLDLMTVHPDDGDWHDAMPDGWDVEGTP